MIELVKSNVVFNNEDHTYRLGNKMLHGITGMIKNQLFPDKYKDIPTFVLQRAAERGSRVHEQCQFVDETGMEPDSMEAKNYLFERENAGYVSVANEYTVSDDEYFASNIDCVWMKGDSIALADIKTTSSLDEEYLSWQLSIYAYLFEMQNPLLEVDKLYGVWLRGDISELVEINRKPNEDVIRLLECERNGEKFLHSIEKNESSVPQIIEKNAVDMLVEAKQMAAYYKELEMKITNTLMEAMKANAIKSWDAGIMKASYTAPSKTSQFDSKKFQEEHPELYKQYLKEVNKKESIRITIR